ncbi:universal stress protein [Corynebacterium striatum]|uniref:universal stress protein n=1 Tax=Corynebacterium striatum TaxID=43770 RepID=UPI000E060242|nr:universal stress protein [Corynebacterium striatum]STD39214.1 universal stress protein [Corynebacterium striatum]
MAKNIPCESRASLAKEDPNNPVRLLVSWSPSSTGTEAIEYAAWLARSTKVCIRVISTISVPRATTVFTKHGGKYKKWFKKEQAKCEQSVLTALKAAGVDNSQLDERPSVLLAGPSRPQLLTEMATEFCADAILLGANQSAPKGKFFAGSTADALLHFSPIPLGLTPRDIKLSKHGVTRINFAFTERGDSEDPALLHAARLANRWKLPLRIVAFNAEGLIDAPLHDSVDIASKLTKGWHEHTLAMLDRAQDIVDHHYPGLEISTDIGTGHGWAGAVDSLKWKKGDIMCMGSSPMGPIERVFIGSAATELLPHIRVPVMVRPSDSAPIKD